MGAGALMLRCTEVGHVDKVRLCGRCYGALSLDSIWEQETLVVRKFLRVQHEGYTLDGPLTDRVGRRVAPDKCHWRARSAQGEEVLATTVRRAPAPRAHLPHQPQQAAPFPPVHSSQVAAPAV